MPEYGSRAPATSLTRWRAWTSQRRSWPKASRGRCDPGPEADAVTSLEEAVLAANGVVLRYGAFYGPGTYYER